MRRHIPGLHQAAAAQDPEIPDGFFLVRVERATYRAYKDKPFLTLFLAVEESGSSPPVAFPPASIALPSAVETQLVPTRFRL